MPRNESSSPQAPEVEMPPDGTEDQSPHAAEPVRRAPRRASAKKAATRTVREYEEPVQDGQGEGEQDDREPEFMDESPLSALSEATLAMCHVSRVGPGTGPGWVGGMFYDYGDGRGAVPVSKGPVGTYQKTKDLFDVVVGEAGGGRFRFVTKGQPPYEETFPNAPLPLPMERQAPAQAPFPNGAMPNARGGFERGIYDDPTFVDHRQPQDPFDDPSFDPTIGVETEAFTQSGLNGWYRGGPYNRLIYYVNGQPARPPRGARPPAALLAAGGAADESFNPSIYDHSGDDKQGRLEWIREQEQLRKEEERARREEEKEQRRADEERRREEAVDRRAEEQRRRDEEKEDRRREDDKRREEEKARRDEENRRREQEREDRRRDEERAREDRRAQIEAAKVAADAQANAVKEAARLTAEAQKEAARMQAENNKLIFDVLLKKSGDGGTKEVVDLGLRIAELAQGNVKEEDTASQIATAIERAAPALAKAGGDVVNTYRGAPPQHTIGQPQVPGAPAPQLPAPTAPTVADPAQQKEIAANFQLLGYLISHVQLGIPPSVPVLRSGVIAYGLQNNFTAIQNRCLMASPGLIVSEAEKAVASLGNPPEFVGQLQTIRAVAQDPRAAAWLEGLKVEIRKPPKKPAASAPAPAAPAPAPAPAAPSAQQHPAVTGVDPSRPVIMQTDVPPHDPNAVDPSRPEIRQT